VDVFTNALTDVAANAADTSYSRGVCLTYMQIPCSN
jgi:hypothetical protein